MLFADVSETVRHFTLEHEFLGNTGLAWAVAGGVLAAMLITLKLITSLLERRLATAADPLSSSPRALLHDSARATSGWFLLVVSLYAASLALSISPRYVTVVRSILVTALLLQAALWGNVAMRRLTKRWLRDRMERDPASAPLAAIIGYIGRIALWLFVLLLILDNLGVQVTALLTGLGIGGIAIALALQNILGDLFASLSILIDKPFILGDFIVVGDQKGTVENIGLKTTRLRSLSGEQLIFPNNDLLQSRIHNFKRMNERRIVFQLGVTYDTPPDTLAALPGILREIVESQSPVRFDRAHFQSFGDSALKLEIVYFFLSPDYNTYMNAQQAMNLEIMRRFQSLGVEFAFPTQTLYVQRAVAASKQAPPPQEPPHPAGPTPT